MNTIDDTLQKARQFSTQLGQLAARTPSKPDPNVQHPGADYPGNPSRFSAVLARLRQRHLTRRHMADKLRTAEFIHG